MTNAFYVELSSNEKNYEANTVANFKNRIQLLEPLHGLWEVGLVEISYPKNWKVLKQSFSIPILGPKLSSLSMVPANVANYSPGKERLGIIRAGYYANVKDLFDEINNELQVHKDDGDDIASLPKLELDDVSKLVKIYPGFQKNGSPLMPDLNEELKRLLGFDVYTPKNPKLNVNQVCMADRPADIHANLKTLYVYSDIVVPQYVGDTRCKLLRTVGVPSNAIYDQQIVISYENPHYVDVLTNEFEYIEIDIKDDLNESVPFMHGRSRVKLHFRKKDV